MDRDVTDLARRLARGETEARSAFQSALVRAGRSPVEAWTGLALDCLVDLGADRVRLTPEGFEQLQEDLATLDAERLLAAFPRDKKGLLPLKERTALLASYTSDETLGRGRDYFLAVRSPKRRKDPAVLTLVVESLIGTNHAHRWDTARWLWDGRVTPTPQDRWGLPERPDEALALQASDPVALFERYDVALPRPIVLVARGGKVTNEMAYPDLAAEPLENLHEAPLLTEWEQRRWGPESWDEVLRQFLRVAAPWRFRALLEVEGQRRSKKTFRVRLFALPEQGEQSKLSVFLKRKKDVISVALESTAANDRFPEAFWRRPDARAFSPTWVV